MAQEQQGPLVVIMSSPMRHADLPDEINAITGDIVMASIDVHKSFGPGLLESTYEQCLSWRLEENHRVRRQVPVPLAYRGRVLHQAYRLDLEIDGCVIIEVKAVDQISALHEAQLRTYLKVTEHPVGLLINFNVPYVTEGIRRQINPQSLRVSASPRHREFVVQEGSRPSAEAEERQPDADAQKVEENR